MSVLSAEKFTELFEQYREPYIRFANSFVRDIQIAENLYADTFADFWTRKDILPHDCSIPAYLLTSLRNRALNCLREERRHKTVSEEMIEVDLRELDFRISSLEDFAIQPLFAEEINDIVSRTIASMPMRTREIFLMSRQGRLKNYEISKELGITVKAVEYHITKALKILRTALVDYFPLIAVLLTKYLQ